MKIVPLLLLIALLHAPSLRAEGLSDWLEATAGGRFERADVGELAAAEAAFERLLRGEADEREWSALGFRLTRLGAFWGLSEVERRGRGAYLVRADGGDGNALQAPHRFKDLGSGEIALRLMEEGRLSAAAWNSVPRWSGRGAERVESDLAHESASHHTAFARAFARVHPEGRLVQLHGFARDKRESWSGRESRLIVSGGQSTFPAALSPVARCLKGGFGEGVRRYPQEVGELGGTTNSVGRALREVGFGGFVHLEMSRELRDELLERGAARAALLRCLEERG